MKALTVTYEDVKEDIQQVARTYARRRGADTHEIQSESNLLFLLAYHKYDPDKGDFDRWVKYFINRNLLERSRTVAKQRRQREEWLAANPPADDEGFLSRVLREVGEDAREAVCLLLSGPKGEGPKTALHRVRTALLSRGFPVAEVERVFREIQEAL